MSKERGKILDSAKAIINGERQDQYGAPEDSFALIADYWTTYLQSIGCTMPEKRALYAISAEDVALMMVLFKIAREANQHKIDNVVDCAGYLAIYGDMQDDV